MTPIEIMLAFNKKYQQQNKEYNPLVYITKNLHCNNKKYTCNNLLYEVSKHGDMSAINMIIMLGANNWNMGIAGASRGGHEFFDKVEKFWILSRCS